MLFFTISSCSRNTEIVNVTYDLGNFKSRIIESDLTDALYKGIEIPTSRQIPSGYFKVKFQVSGSSSKKYFYKIYYQNESYKFLENLDTTTNYNPLAEENFYGSWEDTSIGFKPVPDIEQQINDSIKIIGNPREEKKYYGASLENTFYSEHEIYETMEAIKTDKKWYESVKAKALENKTSTEEQVGFDAKWMLKNNVSDKKKFGKQEIDGMAKHIKSDKKWYEDIKIKARKNKVSTEEQLALDAKWVLANQPESPKQNNRWKRNPRMGKYSLMIVLASEEDLAKIPKHIQHINQTSDSGIYINPYYYFNNKKNLDSLPDTQVFLDTSFITVKSSLNTASGIYIDGLDYAEPGKIPSGEKCGWTKELYLNAQFAQFFSTPGKNFHLNTIPLIKDVTDSSYTREEYENATKTFSEKNLVPDYIQNTNKPCEYVRYNEKGKTIEIINPGSSDLPHAHKTNMGVKTRIGFTYGKITAKIKFPELINKYNVWNGLTNAFWLIFQSEGEWNYRRVCERGYTMKGDNRNDAPRFSKTHYSEIDFEMVKTNRYWPKTSYGKGRKIIPEEDAQKTDDIIVACTNWDMTCKDCKKYATGIDTMRYENLLFETNRWDTWYQALTTKTPAKDDELFKSPYYYYQFEWTPNYIIWRIGPEKNKLRVVGYMDNTATSIPNNQMIAVITQEYHLSEWWPPIPFKQEYIPFPKNDISGTIYSIEIE